MIYKLTLILFGSCSSKGHHVFTWIQKRYRYPTIKIYLQHVYLHILYLSVSCLCVVFNTYHMMLNLSGTSILIDRGGLSVDVCLSSCQDATCVHTYWQTGIDRFFPMFCHQTVIQSYNHSNSNFRTRSRTYCSFF